MSMRVSPFLMVTEEERDFLDFFDLEALLFEREDFWLLRVVVVVRVTVACSGFTSMRRVKSSSAR